MVFFIPSNPLSAGPRRHTLPLKTNVRPQTTRRHATTIMMAERSAWPFLRFVKTATFYSPFGKFMRGASPDPAEELRTRARKAVKDSKKAIYLVTGANGGSGRRIVRNLLRMSKRVRALTRDREKLIDALLMVGVDALEEEKKGNLDIFVADLFNVRTEMFENVIAVASCTGTRVGPKDDPDRSKYFQGKTFYQPVILEDTPENVEYRGIKNLAEAARKHFEEIDKVETIPVLEFADVEKVRAQWGPLDDVVMGGVSESILRVENGELVFSGFVSTNNSGGFVSARTVTFDTPMDLSPYDGIDVRVKGDGQSYKLIIRCNPNWDGISHCYTFPTEKETWEEVRVPFSEFNTVFRSKTLKGGEPLNPKRIFAFQIMLSKFEYDGDLNQNFKPGVFQLRIDSLSAYKDSGGLRCPKIVHIGSAATTRVLRSDEEFDEVPPAVKLNEQLGRLLNWKLAGEDSIRVSGVPYCILRPTALTEEEPVGLDRLKFDQGDNLTGNVGRDDIADAVVRAFATPELTNVTTEVSLFEGNRLGVSAAETFKELKPDKEEERTFATFPYVPESKPSEKTSV